MRLSVMLAGLAGLICVQASAAEPEMPWLGRRLFSMTPEQFAQSATLKDDALETSAMITTRRGFLKNHGIAWLGRDDCFLRAFIDKKTGVATYQLYAHLADRDTDRDQYRFVNYETPSGPRAAELIRFGRIKDCRFRTLLGRCEYSEDVALPIDEALLTAFAARYEPGGTAAWYFRFKAQSGEEYTDGLAAAEIAGLLSAVAEYRRAHHLPGAGGPAKSMAGR